jgi:hypothetical protein
MKPLGQILLATAVFRVVTCLMILQLSHTSTDLMTQEVIILLRRLGRQCLVTLMRERCVIISACSSVCFLIATFQASMHTPGGYPGKTPTNIYGDGREVCH